MNKPIAHINDNFKLTLKSFTGVATNNEEIAQCLELRHKVFVEEQKIFKDSDIDKLDSRSIYLYSKINNRITGTVRLTKIKEGFWLGSRLAVEKDYRNGMGILLIESAKMYVSENGGGILYALVQKRAERLFKRLGWKALREVYYHNIPHTLMEVKCVQLRLSIP